MAMRTASPWWASLIYVVGLVFLFIGERAFSTSGWHVLATGLGALLVVGVTGLRVWTTLSTRGARRRVERTLLLCHIGTGVALLLYALTTGFGMDLLGLGDLSARGALRYRTAMTVVWTIIMAASLIPLFMIEVSLGGAHRDRFDLRRRSGGVDEDAVEYYRVRELGLSGLTIALAAAFLMVTCNVAEERNVRKDVSYFRTSAPGESTRNIVKNQGEPIKVLLFFPDVNEVKEEVKSYFEALGSATGKVEIEEYDRMVSASVAQKYSVTKDGVVVMVRGDKNEKLELDTDMERARRGKSKLRNLDREVNGKLLKLVREKRRAYFTVGHGEMTDPDSLDPSLRGKVPERRTSLLKRKLGDLNYEIKELGLVDLATNVPEDATIVMMLAPSQPLQEAELAALARYLDRGGKMLVALDPRGANELGALEPRLGVAMKKGYLTDDRAFLPQQGTMADRRWPFTTQFSAHASTTTLSRTADKGGLLLIEAGALEDRELAAIGDKPKRTYVIRSQATSWLDLPDEANPDGNFIFDDKTEKRDRYNLGAAIEGPKVKDAKGEEKDGYRAMVFSDGDLFADLMLQSRRGEVFVQIVSGPLLDDAIKWLGGEEVFAGEVVSEDDVAVRHTRDEDAVWFYVTVVGAPIVVLVLGLTGTWWRRRRPHTSKPKRIEVAS